jgi:hypothetical protein
MWLVIDDTDGFDSPVGWEDSPTVTVTDYTYAPLDEADECTGRLRRVTCTWVATVGRSKTRR